MALLHYENLGVAEPMRLLKSAFFGLGDFHKYLDVTIKYLENEAAVPRLAWEPAAPPSGASATHEDEVWVELREPNDRPDEPDRTFDSFLDEDVRHVFELERRNGKSGAKGRVSLAAERRIRVLDRDPASNRLLLERSPEFPELFLDPNTTTLKRQLAALRQLQDAPASSHLPLLRLFEPAHRARWPELEALTAPLTRQVLDELPPRAGEGEKEKPTASLTWQVLDDPLRPGTAEQRRFVEIALRTPDFAFLEGPPGSGKTTAICELVLQQVSRGKRILLCASTHVAVDNVLERLGPLAMKDGSDLIPVRVGDAKKISDPAKPFQLERLAETERQRILAFLRARKPRTPAQEHLYLVTSRRSENGEPGAVERMILDAANLVCGTTTGILRHPDIHFASAAARAGMFDMLILDEASKTTFQEMLVPALLAKRWIIVGDPRQLSPYIDETGMAANLIAAVPDEATRNACVDVFLGAAGEEAAARRRSAVVVETSPKDREVYERQAGSLGVTVTVPEDPWVGLAEIVLGAPEAIAAHEDRLPADTGTVRGPVPDSMIRRARAFRRRIDVRDELPPCWEDELSWRLCRHYELRLRGESPTAIRLLREATALFPVGLDGQHNGAAERVDRVRRVAFPSALESLQNGFERAAGQRDATALSHGLPKGVWDARHVLLEFQHRMHPEISAFPRVRVYEGTALKDPPDMALKRAWTYAGYQQRSLWMHVDGKCEPGNRNSGEAEVVVRELRRFERWARENPRQDKKGGRPEPWEVAVLTFYRGQERVLREHLRKETGRRDAYHSFELRSGERVSVTVKLCTVDRFQGHEADVVFLSIANTRMTNFLESVNRLNVALTRARYQRVIVGNRLRLRRRADTLLGELAKDERSQPDLGGEK